jgi:hypothetical protein
LICTISTSSVAAVPIGHAVDLDGAEQERQRGRGHDHLGRDLRAGEDAQLAGVDVGGGDEQFEGAVAADRLEIDEALDHLLERIDVEWVEIVGREQPRHCAEPQRLARDEWEQPLGHAALQVGQMAVDADRPPEIREPLARLVSAAAGEAVGQHDRVHRTRRRSRNAFDLGAAVLEQLIEDAPGKGTVRAAALQSEIDRLAARPTPRRRGTPARARRRQRARHEVGEQNGKHSRFGCCHASGGEPAMWWLDCCIAI